MARTWPSLVQRAHRSAPLLSEVVLALLLVGALAFSWRDGVPGDGYVDAFGPIQLGSSSMQVSEDNLYSGFPVAQAPGVTPAPLPQATLLPGQQAIGSLGSQIVLVPTAQPVQLLIPALDVHRDVEAVGVDRRGVMNLPANSWNAGWYKGGPVPGAPGDAVIEGHAGYPDQPMIFGKLVTLRPGDRVVVVLSDGSRHLFLVDSMAHVPVGAAPPGLGEPWGPPRLTLITCTGHFEKNSYSYSERLLVELSYAGLV